MDNNTVVFKIYKLKENESIFDKEYTFPLNNKLMDIKKEILKINFYFLSSLGNVLIYNSSTFLRAQSVFLRKFKLDFIVGLSVKHFILINSPNVSNP